MKRRKSTVAAAPTPLPWYIENDCLVRRFRRYTGWPHFGRIVVAGLDHTWPQGPERHANLELIACAVNACFAVAPNTPIAAAKAFPALVGSVEDVLAHGDDPNMPLAELRNRLETALRQVKGCAA